MASAALEPPVVIEPATPARRAVIWLHGLGADGHDFEAIVPELDLPAVHGIRFLFPHAPVRSITINHGMRMRGWYDVRAADLTRAEDEVGLDASAAAVSSLIANQIASGIAAHEVVIAGFSQGGAIALLAGLQYAEPLAGIVALSTYMPLMPRFESGRAAARVDVPILFGHGTWDPIIPMLQGQRSCEFLKRLGCRVEWREYPMAHSVCAEEIADLSAWLRQRYSL